jgi:CBS domain-containing protein
MNMSASDVVEKIVQNRNHVVCILEATTVAQAAQTMRDHRIGSLVVVDEAGKLAGIFTERDIVRLVADGSDLAAAKVGTHMSDCVITCMLSTPIPHVLRLMSDNQIRHLPVVKDGKPVGMISSRDLMAYELEAAQAVVHSQSRVLRELETSYPGITKVQVSASGRIII